MWRKNCLANFEHRSCTSEILLENFYWGNFCGEVLLEIFSEEVLLENFYWGNFTGEILPGNFLLRKFYWRSFTEEVLLENFYWGNFSGEILLVNFLLRKFYWKIFTEEILLEKFDLTDMDTGVAYRRYGNVPTFDMIYREDNMDSRIELWNHLNFFIETLWIECISSSWSCFVALHFAAWNI